MVGMRAMGWEWRREVLEGEEEIINVECHL